MLPRSHRYPWDQSRNAISAALAARRQLGHTCIDLSLSNPARALLDLPDPWEISPLPATGYEPSPLGASEAREAICRYYEEEFQCPLSPSRIVLTTSTSEAYSYCFKAFADPGGEILIPEPSYPLLRFLVEAEGLTPVPYRLLFAAGEWVLDRDHVSSVYSNRTRALVVVHPNNPTGHYLTTSDWLWLREWTAGRIWLLGDEVFADYDWTTSARPNRSCLRLPAPNLILMSGLSKICALPQMKLGWIVLPPNDRLAQDFDWIADTYLSVSGPIQHCTPAWIGARHHFQAPIRARCLQSLQLLAGQLRHSPWTLLKPEAGWMAILQGPAQENEERLVLQLIANGISVHPGFFYDLPLPNSLVVSLLTPADPLRQGLQAIISS
ncbi:MAG: pyridoxal phosphate-dependent aminotransferase [Acidobacteriota bacterium]